MNQRILRSTLVALLAVSASAGVHADMDECAAPSGAPTIPDGASADAAAMETARDDIRTFVAETQAFLKCMEANEPRAGIRRRQFEESYNAAVDAMKSAARDFNGELRAFKAREA